MAPGTMLTFEHIALKNWRETFGPGQDLLTYSPDSIVDIDTGE